MPQFFAMEEFDFLRDKARLDEILRDGNSEQLNAANTHLCIVRNGIVNGTTQVTKDIADWIDQAIAQLTQKILQSEGRDLPPISQLPNFERKLNEISNASNQKSNKQDNDNG